MTDNASISAAAAKEEIYQQMPKGPWRCRRCLGENEKVAQSCGKCGLQKEAYWASDLDDPNGRYPLSQWWELSALVHTEKQPRVLDLPDGRHILTALGKESTAQESTGQGVESQGSVQRGPQDDDEEN